MLIFCGSLTRCIALLIRFSIFYNAVQERGPYGKQNFNQTSDLFFLQHPSSERRAKSLLKDIEKTNVASTRCLLNKQRKRGKQEQRSRSLVVLGLSTVTIHDSDDSSGPIYAPTTMVTTTPRSRTKSTQRSWTSTPSRACQRKLVNAPLISHLQHFKSSANTFSRLN